MHSRLIRILLVFIGVAIALATARFLKDLDTQITSERAAVDLMHDRASALTATLADVRAGQVAYVAQGQGDTFWLGQVAKLLPTLEAQGADFRGSLGAPGAQSAYDAAAAAIENFQKLDIRVREFVGSGNNLLAADLIFSDGVEATATAASEVNAAVQQEQLYRQATLSSMRRRQLEILGAGTGGVFLLMLILGLSGARSRIADVEPALHTLSLRPSITEKPAAASVAPAATAPPAAVVTSSAARASLVTAAKLCTDLARVLEASQLPLLLERSAKLIEASGVIVWIADPSARVLRPAMSHGYTEKFISRMGTIHLDASNAAAAAYRASQMRTVAGDKTNSGAIVAPLITPDGCIGVLSAEMKGGSEKDESSQALAAIFAAQLAALVAPAPVAEPARVAQA